MCGIAVAIDWDDADSVVRSLVAGIAHRGDVTDPLVSPFPKTSMCTRRLRIVDADHAIQPQASFDGRFLVSMNGEIYNHEALRIELEAQGVRFKTASDTEVLASALRVWGVAALGRLNGMFAFVAIDAETGEFLAARDRWGVKPLYLIQSAEGFLFCSEMKPLLRTVPEGDVLLLPAGHLLTRTTCARYAPAITPPAKATVRHEAKDLDAILSAAVHRRLPPGLPCAIMFSGGIDSTLVAHYARQIRPETPGYFIGDTNAPDYAYAECYANQTGFDLRHVSFEDEAEDIGTSIAAVVETMESFESSVIRDSHCTYLLSRRIHRDGFKVALCGEGADELFAGYPPLEYAFADSQLAGSYVREQCLGYMHRTNLQRLDRCAMRFQLEAREPFLDPAVTSYALSLRSEDFVREDGNKLFGKLPLRSLYDLYPGALPRSIRDRRKIGLHEGSGFSLNQSESPWTSYAADKISDRDLIEGQREFAAFGVNEKEDLLYLNILASSIDVNRVPHLRDRVKLKVPNVKNAADLLMASS